MKRLYVSKRGWTVSSGPLGVMFKHTSTRGIQRALHLLTSRPLSDDASHESSRISLSYTVLRPRAVSMCLGNGSSALGVGTVFGKA